MKLQNVSSRTQWDNLTPWQAAQLALDDGWKVFPLRGKEPACAGGVKDATDDPKRAQELFRSAPNATGVGGACDKLLVVDIDPRNGGEPLSDLPPSRVHYSGRGDGGHHLIFRLTPSTPTIKSSTNSLGEGVDIKTGIYSYVVLPGSIHPDSGRPYRSNDVEIRDLPAELLERILQTKSSKKSTQSLAALLSNPPEVGGRNEWLTRVSGHYATQYRNDEDTYHAQVSAANRLLRSPLPSDEVIKTAESIWETELQSTRDPDLEKSLDITNGWIVSGYDCMRTLAYVGPAKSRRLEPYDLAAFDLHVVGKLWEPDQMFWVYDCELRTKRDPGQVTKILVKSTDLGNPRVARQFFSQWSLSIGSGAELAHTNYDWCSRILMYLDSQDAPIRTITKHYGWSSVEHGYVIGNEVIDSTGIRSCSKVVADPTLTWVGDTYRMDSNDETVRRILTDVLQYQDSQIAALFGSWWAATLVKQWIQPRVSLFPVMAIEAASGSGKTAGMFSLLVELAGSSVGEGHYTAAVLRNRLSSNYNGVTWVDDLEDPVSIHELIRVLTAGGSLSKMDANNNPQQFQLVGSLLMSGESLGLGSQKALRERTVQLNPPPPQFRMSLEDPERSQWLDVLATRQEIDKLGGGSALSGHLLKMVAGMSAKIKQWFDQERTEHSRAGRLQDRDLVLLIGARVLQELMVDPHLVSNTGERETVYDTVYNWVHRRDSMSIDQLLEDTDGGDVLEQDNTLTSKLLPKYLTSARSASLMGGAAQMKHLPGGSYEVAVNPARLAQWWIEQNRGRINERTESHRSLVAQLKQLKVAFPDNVHSSQKRRLDGGRKTAQVRCWVLDGRVAEVIIKRTDFF